MTLKCQSCMHENEEQRIFCHKCSEKLDRSLIPKVEKKIKKTIEPIKMKRKIPVKKIIQGILLCGLLVVGYFAAQEPDRLPEISKKNEKNDFIFNPSIKKLIVSQKDLSKVITVLFKADWILPFIESEAKFCKLEPGYITVGSKQPIAGHPIYSQIKLDNTFKPISFYIGKLPIHPKALIIFPKPFDEKIMKQVELFSGALQKGTTIDIKESKMVISNKI